MGRGVLLITVVAAACTGAASQETREDPHAEVACVTCHRGERAEAGEPAVPADGCAGSACHDDAGPARVRFGSVAFAHRRHGQDGPVALACAGCHTHPEGGAPLVADTEGCALCHAQELDGDRMADCRTCHQQPTHVASSSQGVPIPHEGLPWIEGECVRCHYDVAEPPTSVSGASCAACHADPGAVAAGVGEDLHPSHTGVTCASCHEGGEHRILAMSSAVALECSDCHASAHDLELPGAWSEPATCSTCHRTEHREQQAMVLGVVSGTLDAQPGDKFLAGLTCRSCHVPSAAGGGDGDPLPGRAISCTGCHRSEYATVLGWWRQGTSQRMRAAEAYVAAGQARLGGAAPDTSRALLAEARRLLEVVRAGEGQHNLPLSHDLFTGSLELTAAAWGEAGITAPQAPDLGARPRMGLCSYCHYRLDDRLQFRAGDDAFHRAVLGAR